jgi:serine/threonine protein kinase
MTEHAATRDWPPTAGTASADWPSLPGYEILAELGRGGMGVVYRARQLGSERPVALKLLRDGALAGAQERARFRIEAEAAARMRHPNIVHIYEVGEHRGQPYFAMELIEDGSLDKLLAVQPQPARQAAELIRTLALAVHHAHAQKIVHRDLKPANILLQKSEGKSEIRSSKSAISDFTAKITDFGLAKRLDSDSTALTQDGAVVGTASYMAPEQAAGRLGAIGPAADVYSLGAILYEMLTGRPPFKADSWHQTIQLVLNDEPLPPTHVHADMPADLETVCLKCLEKEPARRYVSARELANDLGLFLEGKPVAAVPVSAKERLIRLAARDGYQIVGEVGRGPRSVVYHALYGALKQPVALKVFRAGMCAREDWDSRIQRATDLWAALAHPQIVAVQRAGWWDGAPYVAAEYIPHGNLTARLADRRYTVPQALRLVEQLAEILRYLHRQGVVHGNLKPSNILFAADGIPRVIDFQSTGGLFVGPLPGDEFEHADLGYLAPEVLRQPHAEREDYGALHPHSDIYSLGVILYGMLTGRLPFAGTTAPEILEMMHSQAPVPPSHLNSEVTPRLDGFCQRCLHNNPWKRYHRAYDMLRRLRYCQDEVDRQPDPRLQWPKHNDPGH